ncbi:LysR substrate-binding domain-containing protein [Bordetella sp. 02P26C-1]|uniref:LysR substrate-binding domain-containing protein n=1 Tax=Bordetella sp. 02P26C-1 TaxID=2683195 RepID=UPI00135496D1|nr:LysR substrate-binding domain-containing protein [Bordetella sp. 02P26C-1]MVW78122.1 LysR family transcriptional regulator [Bordetella sp. 02P26C-1]
MKGSRHSLVTLRIFLAAARTLNFSRCADKLNITQSAVSKHIGALESRLGVALFKRLPNGLRLTHAGAIYHERVSAALRLLDEADALVAHPMSRVALNIAVSPSFAHSCLIPTLSEFFALHPGVRVNIRPRLLYGRDQVERFDAEIQLHTGHVAGMSAEYLCGHEMTLVAAPQLLARCPIRMIEDLNQVPLLRRAQRGYSWDEWRAEIAPLWPGPSAGEAPEYEGFSVLLPAVMHGLGAAIVPMVLVREQLRAGTLVRPLGEVVESRYGYYLMRPRPNVGGAYVDAFCEWLTQRAGQMNREIRELVS